MTNYERLCAASHSEFAVFVSWCLDHIPCDLVGAACADKECGDEVCGSRVAEWLFSADDGSLEDILNS